MSWLHLLSYFLGGAFLANAVPHAASGMMGRPFQSPFAKPPGEGLSSSTVNVLWGFFNLAVGYLLVCHVGDFDLRSLDDAIALVNRNPMGNGVGLFTQSGAAARKFQSEIDVGQVGINIPIPVPLAYHTFGGWKRSAFGDVNQHGTEGVRFWTRIKTVTQRWPKGGVREKSDFNIPTMK